MRTIIIIIIVKKKYSEKKTKKSVDYAVCYSFKSLKCDERDRRNVDKQLKRICCAFKKFRINQNKIKHENKQNKKLYKLKKKNLSEIMS